MANKFIVNGNVNFSSGFTWDNQNNRLGILKSNPNYDISVGDSSKNSTSIVNAASSNSYRSGFSTDNGSEVRFFAGWAGNSGYVGANNEALISSPAGYSIVFSIGSTARAKLFISTGNLSLQNGGTFTDAGYKLDVNGTSASMGALRTTSGNVYFGSTSGFTWDDTNKRLGVGVSAPSRARLETTSLGPVSNISSTNWAAIFRTTSNDEGVAIGGGFTVAYIQAYNGTIAGRLSINPFGGLTSMGPLTVGGNVQIGSTAASAMYWDDTNSRLGIGTSSAATQFHVEGASAGISLHRSGGLEPFIRLSDPSMTYGGQVRGLNGEQGIIFTNVGADKTWLKIFGSTSNFAIQDGGTFTDNGYRLDINGTNASNGALRVTNGNVRFGDSTGFTWDNTNSRLGIGTNSPSTLLHVSKNQNAQTAINISNSTAGTSSSVSLNLNSDGGGFSFAKNSSLASSYKISLANDAVFYNGTVGDISFLNDVATGKIKFAAGASSTPQLTLTSAGRLLLGTTTENTFLLDVNGTARVTGAIIGAGALAVGFGSIAFCTNATAGGNEYAVALGYDAQASNAHAIAIGYSSRASANPSVAIGKAATASGTYSTAFSNATASGNNSVAFGSGSISVTESSVAMGNGAYAYLTGQTAISGGKMAYNGDSQYSVVTLRLNTGTVNSGGVYSFPGIRPSNGTFGSGVAQIWLAQVKILFAVRAKSVGVTEFNLKDVYTAIYHLSVTSDINNGTSIIGTPALVNKFSHSSMSGSSVSFTIVSNNLVTSVTPPTWASGQVEFRGTVSYELTELGVYPATI